MGKGLVAEVQIMGFFIPHCDWLVDGQPAQETYSHLGYSASSPPLNVGNSFSPRWGSVLTPVGEMVIMSKKAFSKIPRKVIGGEWVIFPQLDGVPSPN